MSLSVTGWVQAYLAPYPTTDFTEERKRALVERIRKRRYNFTYDAHQTLPYAAPFYSDKKYCVISKPQWDEVLSEAYADMPRPPRQMPMDVITKPPKNDVLYEKEKYTEDGESNG